jgi:hypothetical protein
MSDGIGRRRFLTATTGVAALCSVTGCLSGGSDGYRVRMGDDADWQSLTPLETGSSHREAYCGAEDEECETAQHGLDRSNVVTMFLHRDVTGDGDTDDALVLTYDTPDDSAGSAVLELDEPISVEEDLIVADGPVGEDGRTGDSYEPNRLSHTWAENYTDGAVIALEPLSEPTLEFIETDGLDEMVVLSGSDPADTEAYSSAVDLNVTFDV